MGKCKYCQKPVEPFRSPGRVREYCNRTCYQKARRGPGLPRAERACIGCGKTFQPKTRQGPARQSCDDCHRGERILGPKLVVAACKTCGNVFESIQVRKPKAFCSQKCRNKSTRMKYAGRCVWCQREFVAACHPEQRFCSQPCSQRHRAASEPKTARTCVICGITFEIHRLQILRNTQCCSMPCSRQHWEEIKKSRKNVLREIAFESTLAETATILEEKLYGLAGTCSNA